MSLGPLETVATSFNAANGIFTITLNRPQRKNAVNTQVYLDMVAAFKYADENPAVKAVVLTGAGGEVCRFGARVRVCNLCSNMYRVLHKRGRCGLLRAANRRFDRCARRSVHAGHDQVHEAGECSGIFAGLGPYCH